MWSKQNCFPFQIEKLKFNSCIIELPKVGDAIAPPAPPVPPPLLFPFCSHHKKKLLNLKATLALAEAGNIISTITAMWFPLSQISIGFLPPKRAISDIKMSLFGSSYLVNFQETFVGFTSTCLYSRSYVLGWFVWSVHKFNWYKTKFRYDRFCTLARL